MVVGDTIYTSVRIFQLLPWVVGSIHLEPIHMLVENGSSGDGTSFFVDGTLYYPYRKLQWVFSGLTLGYNLLSINYQTNTGGNVTVHGPSTEACRADLLWHQQRYDIRNTDRIVDANVLHGMGQQQRWLQRGLPQHHHRGPPSNPLVCTEHAGADHQQPEQRLAAECNIYCGYHHLVGNQCNLAIWTQLRYVQRNDLGYSDRSPDNGDNLHDLGQQLGRFNFGHHHDYDQR